MTHELDLLQTMALALVVLLVGSLSNRRVAVLRRYNIPAPVVGGLLFAGALTVLHGAADLVIAFDMRMKDPFMLAFFSTVGLSANLRLLRRGGPRLAKFLLVAALFVVVQNAVGVVSAVSLDLHPLLGLICGSLTLSGGHGTGAAYAQSFAASHNLQGVMELALASATFGLVIGGLLGGPLAGVLIRRHSLHAGNLDASAAGLQQPTEAGAASSAEQLFATALPVLICLVGGQLLHASFGEGALTLPPFMWCLFVGVGLRNGAELTGWVRFDEQALGLLGSLSLSVFLALALMSLRLWELLVLAGPMLALLAAQTLAMAGYAYFVTFRAMGGSYDAAVLAGGHCGFGMGATPTAVANLQAVTDRHGPSPDSFLVIPLVGAFFIDLVNALVVQGLLTLPVFGLWR